MSFPGEILLSDRHVMAALAVAELRMKLSRLGID
jgi:hypothetical protein